MRAAPGRTSVTHLIYLSATRDATDQLKSSDVFSEYARRWMRSGQ